MKTTGTDNADAALVELLRRLDAHGYRFVAPTPATHARVVARPDKKTAVDLRDVFGWSLPFSSAALPSDIFDLLGAAGMLVSEGAQYRSLVRVASVDSLLFVHSAFPTDARDAVFFGPDSYRFARFVLNELVGEPAERLIDIGAGAGVGAVTALAHGRVQQSLLTDINPTALRFARINAAFAGVAIETSLEPGAASATDMTVAIMNPPFVADDAKRVYRDGGGSLGAGLSIQWSLEAARRIAPGGRVLLYSGSAIVGGLDGLASAVRAGLPPDCTLRYFEIDPDIFGEELERQGYRDVERIAAIGAVIRRQG